MGALGVELAERLQRGHVGRIAVERTPIPLRCALGVLQTLLGNLRDPVHQSDSLSGRAGGRCNRLEHLAELCPPLAELVHTRKLPQDHRVTRDFGRRALEGLDGFVERPEAIEVEAPNPIPRERPRLGVRSRSRFLLEHGDEVTPSLVRV